MKKSKMQDIDHGWGEAKKQIKAVGGKSVRVGVLSTAGKAGDGETSLAEVAFFNEFGTKKIPERSFLRTTIDENRAKYVSFVFSNMQKVLAGKLKGKAALDRLGMLAQSDVRKKIKTLKSPANAASTIANKGSDNPLVDTGSLLRSIDYEVKT